MEISMSKTIRHGSEHNVRSGREDAPGKEDDVPAPYPPVQPPVGTKKNERKNR
jgi:hypothetical protein